MENTMQATLPEKIGDCSRFLEKGDFPYHATLYVDDQIIHCSGLVLSYWSAVLERELEIDSGILLKPFGFEGCTEAVKDCVKILHGGEITIFTKNAKIILKFSLVFDIKVLRKLVLSWVKKLELTDIEELEFTLDLAIQWKKLCLVYNQKDQGDIILDLISEKCNRRHSCHQFLSLLGTNLEQSDIILDMVFNFKIKILSHELNSELMRYVTCESKALQILDLIIECVDNRLEISDDLFDHLYDHISNIDGERLKKIARFHQTMSMQNDKNKQISFSCSDYATERSACATNEISYTITDMGHPCSSKCIDSKRDSKSVSKQSPVTISKYNTYKETYQCFKLIDKDKVTKYVNEFNKQQLSTFMRSHGTAVHYQRLEIFLKWFCNNGHNLETPDEYVQKNLEYLNVSKFPKDYIGHINQYIHKSMKLKDVNLICDENESNLRCHKFVLEDDHRRMIGAGDKRLCLILPRTQEKILFTLRDNLPCYVLTDPKFLTCENNQIPVYHWFIRYKERERRRGPMNFLSLVTTDLDTVLSIISDIEKFSVHLFGFIEQ